MGKEDTIEAAAVIMLSLALASGERVISYTDPHVSQQTNTLAAIGLSVKCERARLHIDHVR
jgi:hypothetical protein